MVYSPPSPTDTTAMQLTEKQKRHLRTLGHRLRPVVRIGGKGLSENVLEEIAVQLDHHELIKISVSVGDRALRDRLVEQICSDTRATLIQRIGNMALVFRRNPRKPRIPLKLK
ncbi:ribosome assembly RNA-binding protein YhbY [Thiohalobacter sp.]|uniref:ribosome assembly RNA-binding protein YhbY n=1 Tax=Thiohalobacter sp. TaxID=2025948 RepID=UPI0039833354